MRRALQQAEEQTRRRQAEEALREQAELLDQSTEALLVRELDGTLRYWSRGAEELFG